MKKLLFFIVSVVVIAISATPAFASGSHHGGIRAVNYSVCAVKNCTQTGQHIHNGKTYTAHYYNDGHTYHTYCGLDNCDLTGYHAHDGMYCFGHSASDGHSYHHTGRGHH